ncbi:hypothetical protein FBF25_04410 [Candidatus Saccharibacteria bacterium oral taxon 488]|nr:hypothetical protein FBF25_04410 [Candidatus Saccharibacteria bacterium oral taxon 488]QLF52267.1 hypothetical protein HW277_04460 [Candidatus Saccharibacteria bacterium oral taxon 488]
MSPDSISHLEQATGVAHLTDWHPPVMTRLWGFLIRVTGHISSMLIFQLMLLVAAMFMLSIIVYRHTRNRVWALSIYMILLLPNIVNIAGVIWKDVQMAFSLTLAVLLIWFIISSKKSLGRVAMYGIVGLTLLLILYAGILRHNALFAVLPILFVLPSLLTKRLHVWSGLACMAAGLIVTIGATAVINQPSEKTHPITAVQLDDIVHVANLDREHHGRWSMYKKIHDTCRDKTKDIMNSYIICTTAAQREALKNEHQGVFNDWLLTIIRHPIKYVSYRLATFSIFLFPQPERMYIFQPGIEQNQVGAAVKNEYAISGLAAYVKGGAQTNIPMIFQPWLYLVILMFIYYKSGRIREQVQRHFIRAVALSGLIYIVAYFPMAVAVDYRYIYWSVFATILSGLFTIILSRPKKEGRRS